jgi:hypothetical protein
MDKVKKADNSECYTALSEPFRKKNYIKYHGAVVYFQSSDSQDEIITYL